MKAQPSDLQSLRARSPFRCKGCRGSNILSTALDICVQDHVGTWEQQLLCWLSFTRGMSAWHLSYVGRRHGLCSNIPGAVSLAGSRFHVGRFLHQGSAHFWLQTRHRSFERGPCGGKES
ncbi:unnamed protein product [Ostreobium quekettii]|uniref:Uncharacterized protein n=1 Tax=Ostreobium quekettii TaxID=121088 RepID=A0A8S1JFF4_9CHLO|nr:unnamed protein product [Ostreobium quekettii]